MRDARQGDGTMKAPAQPQLENAARAGCGRQETTVGEMRCWGSSVLRVMQGWSGAGARGRLLTGSAGASQAQQRIARIDGGGPPPLAGRRRRPIHKHALALPLLLLPLRPLGGKPAGRGESGWQGGEGSQRA